MPIGPLVINTGDSIDDFFRYRQVANGTGPFSYAIQVRGIGNSGVVATIGGAESNEVTFDATNALAGDYRIEVVGTVTDANGDRDTDQDVLFLTVLPVVTGWGGSLSDVTMDNTATSVNAITRGATSGGQAPYTLGAEWVGGTPPHPTIGLQITGNASINLTTADTPSGTYQGEVRATVTDNLGQQITQNYPVSFTVAGAVYTNDGPLLVDEDFGEEGQSNLVTITAVSGAPGPIDYFGHQFVSSDITGTTINVAGNTVSLTTPASNPNSGVFSNTLRVQARDATGVVTEILIPVTIRHDAPLPGGNTLYETLVALGADSIWQLDEMSGLWADTGADPRGDLAGDGSSIQNNTIFRMPGLARGEPRVYGAWGISGFGYGNPTAVTSIDTGYDADEFGPGSGLGVICLLSAIPGATVQWAAFQTWDGSDSRYIGIGVEDDGTLLFRCRASASYQVTARSLPGTHIKGEPIALFGTCGDDVSQGPRIWQNGVDVTDSVDVGIGAGSQPYDSMATLQTRSSIPGLREDIGFMNPSSGGPAGTNSQRTGIVSMPHVFASTALAPSQIANIYSSLGLSNPHDDYLEYMISKVGRSKLYWPGLNSYGNSTSVIPLITNTDTSGGNPRFQAGVADAIEVDDFIETGIQTVYEKIKWDQTGSDDDAYLRNWTTEVPFCEVSGEDGDRGVLSCTIRVDAQPVSTAYWCLVSGGTDHIYSWFESGVGSEIQLHLEVQQDGVVEFKADLNSDPDLVLGNVLTIHWIKRVGEDYEVWINGRNVTGDLNVTTDISQVQWFGMDGLRGASQSGYLMGGLIDYDHQSHEFFYLNDEEWTAADVAEHVAAQQGVFP